jgi:dihydroneopterin aldolase/D-erythro-7,8-dihydroneopterin triphosphate epimerase
MDRIHIRDLRLRCIIGVFPEERREKQDIVVNIVLEADLRRAGRSDKLADTVDYKGIKKEILKLVEGSGYLLIEALAEAIAGICLRDRRVRKATVAVDKPGALRFARSVAVEIVRTRQPSTRSQ